MSQNNYTYSSSPSNGTGDSEASTPRVMASPSITHPQDATTLTDTRVQSAPTCGMVIHPNNTRSFVDDKEAYFAANPATRASTEASMNDYAAWAAYRDARSAHEARVKAEKQAKQARREKEKRDAGLHGCIAGKVYKRCGACGGNGCAGGMTCKAYQGVCGDCEGKGLTPLACEVCEAEKQKQQTSGVW